MAAQVELFGGPPAKGRIGAVERWAARTGRVRVMGVDEVGRGPLAGCVMAAAVVLPPKLPRALRELNDSKQLTAEVRERLVPLIAQHALAIGIGRASPERIDEINILQATFESMRQATTICARRLGEDVDCLFVDGNKRLPGYTGEQFALIKGDGRSHNIAAASVVAKVVRDRLLTIAERHYPGYGFAQHKGYGTIQHRLALVELGPCPIHRRSFKWTPPT